MQEWTFISPMKEPRSSFSVVVNNDFSNIYALGGLSNNPLNTVERFNYLY